MAAGLSLAERIFVQPEAAFGEVPNTAGAATVAASNYMRHTRASLNATQGEINDRDKNASGDLTLGSAGVRGGNWSLSWEARPRGSSAWRPDWAAVLESAMEAAGSSPGSGVYDFALSTTPTVKSFSMYRYRGAGLMSQLGIGCVPNELRFVMEQGANCRFEASGPCLWVRDSVNWSTDAGVGLGALTLGAQAAFPTEPSSPVGNGVPVNALSGTATLDGNTTVQVKTASVILRPGFQIPQDKLFAGAYGSSAERDTREFLIDLSVIDEDISAVTNLYSKARSRTPIAIELVAGTVTSNRFKWTGASCVLPEPAFGDDARKWAANLAGIRCYAPTALALSIY